MTRFQHDEHLTDRAKMLVMRAAFAMSSIPPFMPESRAHFDELIAKTPAPEKVDWSAAEVGGIRGWWCRPPLAIPEAAILYLHGGAYVLGSASAYRGFASQVASRAGVAAFVADYGLAPERPFPAAFDDARRAYDGLRAQGFRGIALSGDSAGGGLALSLLAALAAAQTAPSAAAVFSPWIDLSLSGESMQRRAAKDPLVSYQALVAARDLYLAGARSTDPRANALYGDLSSISPLRIDVGEDEVLLDDSVRLHEHVESTSEGRCELHVWKGMVHVFPASVTLLKAAVEALDGAGEFLARALRATLAR